MSIFDSDDFWDRVCEGDKASRQRLFAEVYDRIRFVARNYSKDEDFIQEVVLCAMKKGLARICRKRLTNPSGVKAFFGWGANKCALSILKRIPNERRDLKDDDFVTDEWPIAEVWILWESLEAIRDCLPELKRRDEERRAAHPDKDHPQRFRIVYERYFARPGDSPISFKELGDLFGKPPTTLQDWFNSALELLKPCVENKRGR